MIKLDEESLGHGWKKICEKVTNFFRRGNKM